MNLVEVLLAGLLFSLASAGSLQVIAGMGKSLQGAAQAKAAEEQLEVKSTLLKLLPRFYRPSEGKVLIDGLGIFVGAGRLDRGEGDAIAVDEELDIVRAFEALDLLVAVALEADLDLIIAVAGKQIRD